MKELTVISGKGGTGKTSLVASFAALAGDAVVVDCDVDAPDLHLVLDPRIERQERFVGGRQARIRPGHCTACGKCEELCRFEAIRFDGPGNGQRPRTFRVDPVACEGCGVCAHLCAEGAIAFEPVVRGEWYVSATRFGPLVHARMKAAAASSGKLVSRLREAARETAAATRRPLVIADGSPGLGCPVIASITGATLVLAVTEPTLAGAHDLERVHDLARHLEVPVAVCVNRADVDLDQAGRIEAGAAAKGAFVLPRVRYDPTVADAQAHGRSVVERRAGPAAEDVEKGWQALCRILERA